MEFFLVTSISYKILASAKHAYEDQVSNVELYTSTSISVDTLYKVQRAVEHTPHLPSPYAYFDYNGQLQTFIQFNLRNFSRLFHQYLIPKNCIEYTRELLKLRDGGTIALDWARQVGSTDNKLPSLSDESPIVVMYHGLVGDSQSEYIIHLAGTLSKLGQ